MYIRLMVIVAIIMISAGTCLHAQSSPCRKFESADGYLIELWSYDTIPGTTNEAYEAHGFSAYVPLAGFQRFRIYDSTGCSDGANFRCQLYLNGGFDVYWRDVFAEIAMARCEGYPVPSELMDSIREGNINESHLYYYDSLTKEVSESFARAGSSRFTFRRGGSVLEISVWRAKFQYCVNRFREEEDYPMKRGKSAVIVSVESLSGLSEDEYGKWDQYLRRMNSYGTSR